MMTRTPAENVQFIEKLDAVCDTYKAIICDLWGVLHNGVVVHSSAILALQAYRSMGGWVCLLSNSPRPSHAVEVQLREMGVPRDCYDAIITSGDLAQAFMNDRYAGKAYFHLGPQRDMPTIEGIRAKKVTDIADADVVLCTGLFEDEGLLLEQHDPILAEAFALGLPFLCANPDRVVDYADHRAYCAGALADRYGALGGEVTWLGKPYAVAYEAVVRKLKDTANSVCDESKTLAIGDSLVTDILGANDFGCDSLLILEGLHNGEFHSPDTGQVHIEKLNDVVVQKKIKPTYVMLALS